MVVDHSRPPSSTGDRVEAVVGGISANTEAVVVECPQHVAEVGYHRGRFDVDKSVAMYEQLAGIDRMIANEILATFVALKVGDDIAVYVRGETDADRVHAVRAGRRSRGGEGRRLGAQ